MIIECTQKLIRGTQRLINESNVSDSRVISNNDSRVISNNNHSRVVDVANKPEFSRVLDQCDSTRIDISRIEIE